MMEDGVPWLYFKIQPVPHVTFVPLVGFRVREAEMLELGMSLPGLHDRAQAIGQLPALGLLTLETMIRGIFPLHPPRMTSDACMT